MQRVSVILSVNKEKSILTAWIPRVLVALLFCAAMLGRTAIAQTGQQFVGHIEDPSHASIAGATITVHNEATAEDVVVKATGAGDYTVPYLKSGNYTITADMTGFETISKTHIHLDTDQSSKIDFTLPIGSVTETVTVNSAGSQIELSKADRGEIIDAERITEMPSNGRNLLELFALAPGAANTHGYGDSSVRPEDNVAGNLYANGGTVTSAPVQENIDGATNDNAGGYLGYPPVPDAVAEFKAVLNPYDASYGRAGGGAIDITLKSGTNKLHGNLYEFARRPWLDAPLNAYNYQHDLYLESSNQCPPFPAAQPAKCVTSGFPSAHKRDQFGAGADGPIVIPYLYNGRDKTFFTIQWEQVYEDVPDNSTSINSLPDPLWLQGNFNSAQYAYSYQAPTGTVNKQGLCSAAAQFCNLPLGIFDPTQAVSKGVIDPNDGGTKDARQQFPGNNCGNTTPGVIITCMVPQNRIDPLAKALAPYYNALTPNYNPGIGNAPFQNNFYFQPVEHDYVQNGLVKIDQNFGSRDRGSVRWEGFARYSNDLQNGVPTSNLGNDVLINVQPKDNNYALEEIHTFSANLILDSKITLLNERQNRNYGTNQPGVLSALGFSQHYVQNSFYTNLFPAIQVSNNPGAISLGPGIPGSSSNPPRSNNIAHNLAFQPSFTLNHGRHTIRGGVDIRVLQFANPGGGGSGQNLTYDRTFTEQYVGGKTDATGFSSGSGVADLVLGYPTGAGITYSVNPFYSQHYFGIWAQDDWKVTPKLTLNLGVRYDILTARTERHNQLQYGFDSTDVNPVNSQLTSHAGFSGPLLGGTLLAGVNGNPRGAYATNLLNIQPRFGAAYAFSSRTSLRAGFGEEFINNEDVASNVGFSSGATGYNNSLTDSQSNVATDNTYPYGHSTDPFPSFVTPPFPLANGAAPTLQQELTSTPPGTSVTFTNPNYQIPSIWDFSVSLEQLLTRRDTIDISYSGTKGYNLTENINVNHDTAAYYASCDITRGGNPSLCTNTASSNPNVVPNPFFGLPAVAGTGNYSTKSTIGADIFGRAYPEFNSSGTSGAGVQENDVNNVHSWYNSLQVTVAHNVSKSFTMHFAYTFSKTEKAGQTIDVVNGVRGRSLSSGDVPNIISLSGVLYLPVGRGKEFLGSTNRLVDALVGGWEISPLYQYTAGTPTASSNNWIYISPLAVKRKFLPVDSIDNYSRTQQITPCAAVQVDPIYAGVLDYGQAYTNAGCTAPAAIQINGVKDLYGNTTNYNIGRNVIYSGVRTAPQHQFDASLSKHFAWNERANLQLRLDAFNVINHLNFNNGPDTTYSDYNFGTFSRNGTPNIPSRELQLSGKITF